MAKLNVNGKVQDYQADDGTPLLWVLREQLGLTGTKYGCGVALCGACTVHIDGGARSPQLRAAGLHRRRQRKDHHHRRPVARGSHPVQKAWAALDVPQCGFCQSGMIMAAAALLKDKPNPSDADIDAAMTNICRCGTYNRVRAAIKQVAAGGAVKKADAAGIIHTEGSAT